MADIPVGPVKVEHDLLEAASIENRNDQTNIQGGRHAQAETLPRNGAFPFMQSAISLCPESEMARS